LTYAELDAAFMGSGLFLKAAVFGICGAKDTKSETVLALNEVHDPQERTFDQISLPLHRRPASTYKAEDCRDQEQDDRNKEDQLRRLDRNAGNTTKSEQRSDQSDDQKSYGPTKHGKSQFVCGFT
jgi:hypothetical protein